MRRALLVLSCVVVSFLGTACGKSKSSGASTASAAAKKSVTYTDEDLAKACAGESFADAPAFVRSSDPDTPSDIVVLGKFLDESSPAYRRLTLSLSLGRQLDVRTTPLVACLDIKRSERPPRVDCSSDLKVYASEIALRVVEVKTGKTLATDKVSLGSEGASCSSSAERGGPKDFGIASLEGWVFMKLAPFLPEKMPPPTGYGLTFDTACAGSPVPGAAAHAEGTKGKLRMAVFSADGSSRSGPAIGELDTATDPESGMKFDTVACIVETLGAKKLDCPFDGGKTLTVHEGTFDVRIVETRTAKVLATKSFKTKSGAAECPTLWLFSEGSATLTDSDPALAAYLAGFGTVYH